MQCDRNETKASEMKYFVVIGVILFITACIYLLRGIFIDEIYPDLDNIYDRALKKRNIKTNPDKTQPK